jgi:DNA (cytosine-5)-methyltransferase 1
MRKLRVLDLFSGIGGFSLGLERAGGFETVAFCEIEPFPRKVLAKHWPGVECFNDVATSDFASIGPVDLVTAGFPCQDISFAGDGAGLTGERSGLFWFILRAVRLVGRPKLLLENVAGLLDRGMGSVLGAMAQIGYDAEWHCIPACAVGAPHIRDRVWIYGYSNDQGEPACAVDDEAPGLPGLGRAHSDANKDGIKGKQPGIADTQERARPLAGSLGPLLDGNRGWVSEPDVPRVAHGLPHQSHRIAALGNAVVPRIPELIGRAIMEAEGMV